MNAFKNIRQENWAAVQVMDMFQSQLIELLFK